MPVKLNIKNFFTDFYIIHPYAETLVENDRKTALIASIIFGVLTLGIVHATCALVERCIKLHNTKESSKIEKTHQAANSNFGPKIPENFGDFNTPPLADLDNFRGGRKVEIMLSGKPSFKIHYRQGATILHIKHFIREKIHVDPLRIIVLNSGKQLEDNLALDVHISTLQITFRLGTFPDPILH